MLDVNPDTIRFIIDRVREFQVKEGVTIPEDQISPSEDWSRQLLADHGSDPTLGELRIAIDDLEPDQQVALVALMWVGRGDYDAEEWDAALLQARDSWNERTADYLIGTPLAADYLAEGLALLGYGPE